MSNTEPIQPVFTNPNTFKPYGRFQILSLDGGGIKGIFSAAVLANVEEDLRTSVVKHFDLIAGTSTGGIIALGLGLGLTPRQLLDFYVDEGPKIFKPWFGIRSLQHWFRRKYSSKKLQKALQAHFQERPFGQSTKRLVIPSFSLGEDTTYLFRTPHLEKLRRDFRVPAWQVGMATSAAPTYFPSARHVARQRLIDGGVWANNPAMVALVEAHGQLKVPMDQIHLCSLGTSDEVCHRRKGLDRGGKLSWGRGNAAVDVILRGQSIGVNNQVNAFLGKDHVLRLDPKVAAAVFSLDGVKGADDLIAKAAFHSREFVQEFSNRFKPHTATQYIPLHSI